MVAFVLTTMFASSAPQVELITAAQGCGSFFFTDEYLAKTLQKLNKY